MTNLSYDDNQPIQQSQFFWEGAIMNIDFKDHGDSVWVHPVAAIERRAQTMSPRRA